MKINLSVTQHLLTILYVYLALTLGLLLTLYIEELLVGPVLFGKFIDHEGLAIATMISPIGGARLLPIMYVVAYLFSFLNREILQRNNLIRLGALTGFVLIVFDYLYEQALSGPLLGPVFHEIYGTIWYPSGASILIAVLLCTVYLKIRGYGVRYRLRTGEQFPSTY